MTLNGPWWVSKGASGYFTPMSVFSFFSYALLRARRRSPSCTAAEGFCGFESYACRIICRGLAKVREGGACSVCEGWRSDLGHSESSRESECLIDVLGLFIIANAVDAR